MTTETIWSEKDMIAATADHCDFDPADCRVAVALDRDYEKCYVVVHEPTGRTSDEYGDAGRWHIDGTAY
jgi:hypothetical protein